MSPLPRRAAAALAAACAAVAAWAPASTPAAAAVNLDTGRLEFGVSSQPTELSWMTGSGVPWRYRYQYLAGGVNTGSGWETWQDRSLPPGQFATDYVNASASAHYIPVLTYYELLQSSPSTGSTESDRDDSNLNNTSTMNAYYANFALLMQRVGATGRTVVVHVEPDLWGYLQQRAGGQGASSLAASVGSSGEADVAGIPNTAAGFADALLHIRDRYAPNAVLATHASMWASGIDIATNTGNVDPIAAADSTASFLGSAGLSSNPYGTRWDLVFHDVDDHDAGWWEKQGSDNQWFTHWWDPSNARFPNFARWLRWVGELHARTGRQQVMWQVPVGNQRYLTMDNACGHYQDNVAQYTLAHASDLRNAGIIAVLFGAGNSCQTTVTDAQGDGVSNGSGSPTSDSLGWCNACNTTRSTVSDDDGGYLRTAVAAYYAGSGSTSAGTGASSSPTHTPAPTRAPSAGGAATAGSTGSTGGDQTGGTTADASPSPGANATTAITAASEPSPDHTLVGSLPTPDGRGAWQIARDGTVTCSGDATFHGSAVAIHLAAPITGMAAAPDGRGYWLVAADGAVFAFGDARFHGDASATALSRPIAAMTATPDGRGYWLIDSGGALLPFGDAPRVPAAPG